MGAKARTIRAEASREWLKAAFQKPARFLIAKGVRPTLPLPARMRIVARIAGNNLLARSFLCTELLKDLSESDPMEFHRFLWANHVRGNSYGKTYEILKRFGNENLRTSRSELIGFLQACLKDHGMEPKRDVESVFDVGCSLGYLLRFLETEVFTTATCLRGTDVDRYAVETGNAYLHSLGSRIELVTGDANDLDAAMGQRKYDVVLCCGVLMYLDEDAGTRAVRTMLAHTSGLLGMITLAHPLADNAELPRSYVRPEDLGFVHNVDRMVVEAGGRIVFRKWTGPSEAVRIPPLFILARPRETN
ncbi:MAG TPA: class I SAM-dependent methyltransferase [Terriglobia bacterium]|nr:class I SAM-dependent methyltransferase [Terriglobia bacterium]